MGRCAELFALSMAAVILLHSVTFIAHPGTFALPMVLTFAAAAVPFVFGGIFVCLALTRFPRRVGQLYAFDLAGAAIGCLLVIVALNWLDGVGAVIACATLTMLAAALLLRGAEQALAVLLTAALAGTTVWAAVHLARYDLAAFPLRYVKGIDRYEVDYERWNSFSRIAVMKPNPWDVPAWSLSSAFTGRSPFRTEPPDRRRCRHVAHRFRRRPEQARHPALGSGQLRAPPAPRRAHCVVGSGGGRDILAAKVFGQKQILAVEINADILDVVNGRFGDYTGHLDRDPIVGW